MTKKLCKTPPEVVYEVLEKFISLIPVSNPTIEVVTSAGREDVVDTYKCYKTIFERLKDVHSQAYAS